VRLAAGQLVDTGDLSVTLPIPAPMRVANPAVTLSGLNRRIFAETALTSLVSSSVHGAVLSLVFGSPSFTAGTSFPALLVTAGSSSHITVDAEL
jgi:hypothetical protein